MIHIPPPGNYFLMNNLRIVYGGIFLPLCVIDNTTVCSPSGANLLRPSRLLGYASGFTIVNTFSENSEEYALWGLRKTALALSKYGLRRIIEMVFTGRLTWEGGSVIFAQGAERHLQRLGRHSSGYGKKPVRPDRLESPDGRHFFIR
jgi:hypothetical protein